MVIQPILITGAARSGTSLVAGIVARCGAFGGDLCGPTRHNKRGQYENTTIRDGVVKVILREMGADPLGQRPLPDIVEVAERRNELGLRLRLCVVSTMRQQGLAEGIPWFYKGAKMCLLWPAWERAFPEARWIFVCRKPEDIASSCLRTSFMRAYRSEAGWLDWVKAHEARRLEMVGAGLAMRCVSSARIVSGGLSEIEEAIVWAGLSFNADGVREFIDPALWHGGKEEWLHE